MNNTAAIILAGGRGQRMDILCHVRPKPALPFAGRFKVIDFSLSNCLYSHINNIAVLTDYQRSHMADYIRLRHQFNSTRYCHAKTLSSATKSLVEKKGIIVSARAYILMDIVNRKSEGVVRYLQGRPGVVKTDVPEGSPALLVMCEALNRQMLAELTVEALAAVEQVTENVSLLPVRSQSGGTGTRVSFKRIKCRRETEDA